MNDYDPIRRYKKKHKPGEHENLWILLLVLIVLIGGALFVMSLAGMGLFRGRDEVTDTSTAEISGDVSDVSDITTDAATETERGLPTNIEYTRVTLPYSDVRKGDLLLLDAEHEYVFPKVKTVKSIGDFESITPEGGTLGLLESDTMSKDLISNLVYDDIANREDFLITVINSKYLYGGDDASGKFGHYYVLRNKYRILRLDVVYHLRDMMRDFSTKTKITSAMLYSTYRSYDDQASLFESYPDTAAKPGCSDYHLGTTFSFGQMNSDGTIEDSFISRNSAAGLWLKNNMANYGFIMRYPSYSHEITGYSIPDQLRYVGIPHATYIMNNGLCLEEYLDEMRSSYPFSTPMLIGCADGWEYLCYFVPATDNGDTSVPVPTNCEYTVSGNNVDGFIVAIRARESEKTD